MDQLATTNNIATVENNTSSTPASNVPPVAYATSSPAPASNSNRIFFNKRFIVSPFGLLRIALIIFLFALWVAAASVPKLYGSSTYLAPEYTSTRDACLAFSISGWIISILIFILFLLNIPNAPPMNRLPSLLIVFAIDVIYLIPTFVIAIVCAVREAALKNPTNLNSSSVNQGAFAAAAFFGFLCALIYGVDSVVLWFKRSGIENYQ